MSTNVCVEYFVNTSGSRRTLLSLDTEQRPLRGGAKVDLDGSIIFFDPGIGIEELLVCERGFRTALNGSSRLCHLELLLDNWGCK